MLSLIKYIPVGAGDIGLVIEGNKYSFTVRTEKNNPERKAWWHLLSHYHPDDEEKLLCQSQYPHMEEFLGDLVLWTIMQSQYDVILTDEFLERVAVCHIQPSIKDWSLHWSDQLIDAYRRFSAQKNKFRFHALLPPLC
tara:strand:- start:74 stop:487 length:414 start_codon:yes stop_codon:yes gene_type:complete